MTVDQSLWLFFAVAVFLAAVLLFVVVPARIRRNRQRLRDVAPRLPPAAESPPAATAQAGTGEAETPLPAFPEADGPPDDLRRMKGVGPRLATLLNDLGITRFSQIAAMGPAELAALDARLGAFQGRPERDRWQEQARLLAAGDVKGFERLHGKLGPEA